MLPDRLLKSLLLFLFIFSLLAIQSCGPSQEEKARKIAMKDSAAIDSALRAEDSLLKIKHRRERLKKDSLQKAAADTVKKKTDSAASELLAHQDSLKARLKKDSIKKHLPLQHLSRADSLKRVFRRDSIRKYWIAHLSPADSIKRVRRIDSIRKVRAAKKKKIKDSLSRQ